MVSNKAYSEYKEQLKITYEEVINHPEYVNKTYSGKDFFEKLQNLKFRWLNLVCKGTNSNLRFKVKDSLDYKMFKWCSWMHNFNKVSFFMTKSEKDSSFKNIDFLEGLLSITKNFLDAKSREEEYKSLDTLYMLDFYFKDYHTSKYIWLTEKDVNIESNLLPMYAPYDLTFYKRDKSLLKYYKKTLEPFDINIDDIMKEDTELWRIYKIAVEKGILIDNYGKDIAYE